MKISSGIFCLFDVDASYVRDVMDENFHEELEQEFLDVSVNGAFSSAGFFLWQGIKAFEKKSKLKNKRKCLNLSCQKKLKN